MKRQYFLGADIGTTAIKAALFDDQGHKVIHCTQEYDLIKPDAPVSYTHLTLPTTSRV